MYSTSVLVVDDTPANLELLEEVLDDKGFDVRTVTSGEKALEMLKNYRPDIILLDIMMPGIDGYQTCSKIKAIETLASIPIIFLSAKDEIIDKIKGFKVGAIDYLTKPIELDELLARVENHLKNYFLQIELEEKKLLLEEANEVVKLGILKIELKEMKVHLDKTAQALLEVDTTEINYEDLSSLAFTKDQKKLKKLLDEAMNYGIDFVDEIRFERSNRLIYLRFNIQCIMNSDQEILYLSGSIQDISEAVLKRNELQEYITIIEKNILTSKTDTNGKIIYVSEAFADISGYKKEELLGKNHNLIRHPDTSDATFEDMWKTITSGRVWHGEYKNRKKDGGFYWVSAIISPDFDYKDQIVGYTAVRYDITDKKKVEELSITDQLTQLYNRRHFNEVLPLEMKRAIRHELYLAFAMLDVDHFKQYNDTYGHQMGDRVLEGIGKRLKVVMERSEDIVFRLGGEEFGVLFNVADEDGLKRVLEKLRASIEDLEIEHSKNSASPYVTASFGCLLVDFSQEKNRTLTEDEVYRLADEELYKAKEGGRNQFALKVL
jgi:diguanylate cyclase (GGDEF)-like protein/PAS domain S-box-containing protein